MRIKRNLQQQSERGSIALHELIDESELNNALYRANVKEVEHYSCSDQLVSINAAIELHEAGEYDSSVDSYNSSEHLFYLRIQNPDDLIELTFHEGVIDIGLNGKNHLDRLFQLADSLGAELLNEFGKPFDKPVKRKKFLGLF